MAGMYSSDPPDSIYRRQENLLDNYLNMPDKSCFDTPLHFASKYGNVGCVRVLSSYVMCKRDVVNKWDQSVFEVSSGNTCY